MGLMKKMMEPIDKAEAEFRAKQEENNHKQMEELAKMKPTPTIAELQHLMGYVAPKNAELISAAAKARKEAEEKKSEVDKPAEKAGYTTRETTIVSKK